MKKIKVLHVAEIDNDLTKGTSSIIPQYVLEQEKNKGLDVFFLNCNDLKLDFFSNAKNVFNLSSNYKNNIIKKTKPDIVVFHELYKVPYLKLYKFLVKNNIPYIIIPHGGMTKKAQNIKFVKKNVANFLMFYNFFKNAKMIQYLSDKEKEYSKFPKLNNFVLGNGINDIPLRNMYINNKNHFNNNKVNFVYVGRYDYFVKGLDQLIEAFLIARENKLRVTLSLYGKGDNKTINLISECIKNNNLEEMIKLNGPIFGDKKRNTLINNDVFIQVSRTEGQPLGVMEALSLGMPVLLSYGTGYKDIVECCEIGKISDTNSNKIFENIRYVTENRNVLSKFSCNSYKYALENYSWNVIVENTVEMYSRILKDVEGI